MDIYFKHSFRRQFKKLPSKIQLQFGSRLDILISKSNNPLLRIHRLRGSKYPLKSMNVTGDYRALFIQKRDTIIFYEIGTHSELYE